MAASETEGGVALRVYPLEKLLGSGILAHSGRWSASLQEWPSDNPNSDHLGSTDIIMVDDDKPDLRILPFDEVSRLAAWVSLTTHTSSFTDKVFRGR